MPSPAAWAREFFTGAFVDFWMQAIPPEQTRREIDFLEKVLRLQPGAAVLDVPCGGGRHTVELANSRGYAMTGVDVSREFLVVARKTAAERGVSIIFEECPMEELTLERKFDAACCLGNSLGGLDDEHLARFFQGVARALKPGGRFVVDTGTVAEAFFPNFKQNFWAEIGGNYFMVQSRYDPVGGRLDMDFTMIRNGKIEKKSGFQRVHTYREFARLVADAGFTDLEAFSSIDLAPFALGSHGLYLTATVRG